MEQWKILKEAPNYEVSDYGRIRNRTTGRILHTFVINSRDNKCHTTKYQGIKLPKGDGTYLHGELHRLVAQAFISNPENKPEVDHIDGNRENNCATNLRWVTRIENIHYRMQRDPEGHKRQLRAAQEVGWAKCSYYTVVYIDGVKYDFSKRKSASQFLGITSKVTEGWFKNPNRIPKNIVIECNGKRYSHGKIDDIV